jgi:SAM-dependent methyltransferase
MKEQFSCPVCRNFDYLNKFDYKIKFRSPVFKSKNLVRCSKCLTYSIFPVPKQGDLDEYYLNYWKNEGYKDSFSLFEAQAKTRFEYIKKNIPDEQKEIDILDIGSGFGLIAKYFRCYFKNKKINYDVIEIDPTATGYLKKYIHPKNIYINISKIRKKYNVIIMSHILEHLADPYDYFLKIKNLLADKNIIFIEVPNEDFRFKPYQEPHLVFFNPDSLSSFIRRCGFKVIKTANCGLSISFLKLINRMEDNIYFTRHRSIYLIFKYLTDFLNGINPYLSKKLPVDYDELINLYIWESDLYGYGRQWIRMITSY